MYIKKLITDNLVDIGCQWYRNTHGKESEIQKSIEEDSKFIEMTDDYWDSISSDDERYHNSYSPICNQNEIYIEYENIQAYSFFSVAAVKWRHAGGMSPERGLCWQSLETLIKININPSKKKKIKKLFNAILLIEQGALRAESIKLSKK